MATVTGYTAERMKQIEDTTVVGGSVVGDNLILTRRDGVAINAGHVRGDPGPAELSDWANLVDPPGTPKPNFMLAVPAGHGVCDAQTEYDGDLYPLLAAGFGVGAACVNGPCADGKFRLPDLRQRTIFGLHPTVSAFDTMLKAGGTKDSIVVSHSHNHRHTGTVDIGGADHSHGTGDGGGHSHTVGGDPNWASDRIVWTVGGSQSTYLVNGTDPSIALGVTYTHIDPVGPHNHGQTGGATAFNHQHNFTSAYDNTGVGASGANANIPPYRVANWIMRLV